MGFQRPAEFNLAEYWRAQLIRFEAELRPNAATLRANPSGLQRLANLGTFAQAAVRGAAPPDRHGWSTLQLPIESTDHAARLLLGMGDDVEVCAPAELRDTIRSMAKAVARRNHANGALESESNSG